MKNLKKLKITFCPGPGAVIPEWFDNQKEYFGRGDEEYKKIKNKTLKWLRKKSGQDHVIPVPGAATTAAIIALNSFVEGNVLVINTGYYSTRWFNYLKKHVMDCGEICVLFLQPYLIIVIIKKCTGILLKIFFQFIIDSLTVHLLR